MSCKTYFASLEFKACLKIVRTFNIAIEISNELKSGAKLMKGTKSWMLIPHSNLSIIVVFICNVEIRYTRLVTNERFIKRSLYMQDSNQPSVTKHWPTVSQFCPTEFFYFWTQSTTVNYKKRNENAEIIYL